VARPKPRADAADAPKNEPPHPKPPAVEEVLN
jgi:hypothetical protein